MSYQLWLIHNNDFCYILRNHKITKSCSVIKYLRKTYSEFKQVSLNELEYVSLGTFDNKADMISAYIEWCDIFKETKKIVNRDAYAIRPNIPLNLLIKPRISKNSTKMDYNVKGTIIRHGTFTISFK